MLNGCCLYQICNFISIGRGATIIDEEGKTILCACKVGGLFLYTVKKNTLFMTTVNMREVMKWHNRYAHLNAHSI